MRNMYKLFCVAGLAVFAAPLFADGCGGINLNRIKTLAQASAGSNAPASFQIGAAPLIQNEDFDLRQTPIVGLWDIKFTSGGQVVDEGFDAWLGDGTETLNDNPPPSTGNVCPRASKQTGSRTFKLKHPSWIYDVATNTQGIGRI